MSENDVQKQVAEQMLDVEYYPSLPEEEVNTPACQKYSLADVSALGVAFQPLVGMIQGIAGQGGGSGIYYVNTKGSNMMNFQNSRKYLGSLKADNGGVGGGQAELTQLLMDPAAVSTAAMAVALVNIEQKLNTIQELQEEMMSFLQEQERAKVRGNINTLIDVLNNYKFNWDNEKYKTNKHILVQEIRRDAEQNIQLYRQQIKDNLEKKDLINRDSAVNAKIKKILDLFKDYQMALDLYSFSAFLEVLLLGNFESRYLNSVETKLEELSYQYRELYTDCYNWLEGLSQSTLEAAIEGGVAGFGKNVGGFIARIPLINKGPVDEALISMGEKADKRSNKKSEEAMQLLTEVSENGTVLFVQEIQELERLYNQPARLAFDRENIYLLTEAAE